MKFVGSKNRVAIEIFSIIQKHVSNKTGLSVNEMRENVLWIEPFVGGGNFIDKVSFKNRIGLDIDQNSIDALLSIRDSISDLPRTSKEFTENDYKELKTNQLVKHRGYLGFTCSYGGKWMGGWRRDSFGKRDYVEEAYKNALKQHKLLKDVKLHVSDYKDIKIPKDSIIYCDPPYEGTTNHNKKLFNHLEFWEWCRDISNNCLGIFVSEYNAPDDFICLWSKTISSSLTKNTGSKKGIEKLFTI
jgi:DNA adenine methylase